MPGYHTAFVPVLRDPSPLQSSIQIPVYNKGKPTQQHYQVTTNDAGRAALL